MIKESPLQSKVLRDLESFGKYVFVIKIMKTNTNGVPDIFFTSKLTGAVFVEMKRPGETPRKLQLSKLHKIASCGTLSFYCDTWEKWVKIKKELEITLSNLKASY